MYTQKSRKGRIFNKNRKGLKKRKVERRACGEQKIGNGLKKEKLKVLRGEYGTGNILKSLVVTL